MPSKRIGHAYLTALVDRFAPPIRAAFLAAIQDITDAAEIGRLVRAIEANDINAALLALHIDPVAYAPVQEAVAQAFGAAGRETVSRLPPLVSGSGNVVVRFNIRDPRAEAWLAQHSSQWIVEITSDQRQAVMQALEAGMSAGRNPTSTALDIIGRINRATGRREGGIIGLTSQMQTWVENARRQLLSGTPEDLRAYLERQRRDRRFDPTIRRALADGEPVPRDIVGKAVNRYSDRLLQTRGNAVGRTESMAAIHAGSNEAYRQAVATGALRRQDVRRTWRSSKDSQVRDTHADMDGQTVGLDEPYVSPSGARLMYPGDPSAPAAEVINCRCDEDVRIDFLANLE